MNSQKHTPGPWAISRYPVSEDIYHHAIFAKAADDGRTVTVATITPISDDGQAGGESHHNARLIAAAPEMYHLIRAWRFSEPYGIYSDACRKIIETVEKGRIE